MKKNHLTDRQSKILQLILGGLLNKEIAEQLNLSERTVEGHTAKLFAKLGCVNRMDLFVKKIVAQTKEIHRLRARTGTREEATGRLLEIKSGG